MKKALILGVLLGSFLTGCASMQPTTETASGNPEVDIKSSSKQLIKDKIILAQTTTGWNLEQESESILTFVKTEDPTSMRSVMTQALIGNAYSTTPKYETKYVITQNGDNVYKVMSTTSVSSQNAYGQVNKYPLNGRNVADSYQIQLETIKKLIENEK